MLEKPPGWEVDQDKVHRPFREDDAARLSCFMRLGTGDPYGDPGWDRRIQVQSDNL